MHGRAEDVDPQQLAPFRVPARPLGEDQVVDEHLARIDEREAEPEPAGVSG